MVNVSICIDNIYGNAERRYVAMLCMCKGKCDVHMIDHNLSCDVMFTLGT